MLVRTLSRLSGRATTSLSSLDRIAVAVRTVSSSTVLRQSDAAAVKPSIANIAEIRKLLPGTSMIKAREALTASANDVHAALRWLEKDLQVSGAKKASKVSDRTANEGGIAICIVADGAPPTSSSSLSPVNPLAARAGIVELNCETDFVGRNEIFQQLLGDVAHTVALFPTFAMDDEVSSSASQQQQGMIDIPTERLLEFPLVARPGREGETTSTTAKTVGAAIVDVISRLGERVHLARAASLNNVLPPSFDANSTTRPAAAPWCVASAFAHGAAASTSTQQGSTNDGGPHVSIGRVGSLLLTRIPRPTNDTRRRDEASLKALRGLTRSLARQAAGMPTTHIRAYDDGESTANVEEGAVLYDQPFMLKLPASKLAEERRSENAEEETVRQALQVWGSAWVGEGTHEAQETVDVVSMRRWQLGEI